MYVYVYMCLRVCMYEHIYFPYSYDIIFSNWLLMYLNEKEVQELMTNTLSWLDEDGYFFTRESCFHPAGTSSNVCVCACACACARVYIYIYIYI